MRLLFALLAPLAALCQHSANALPSPTASASPARLDVARSPADLFRIRVLQLLAPVVSVSGMNITAERKSASGFHAFILKKSTKAGETVWTLTDRDSGVVLSQITGARLAIEGEQIRINLKAVPDSLVIESRTSRVSDVIATLDLETYLKGVLPSEMPASWPMEALKAQAVAARTFAIFRKAQRAEGSAFDLDSDVSDQMFSNPLSDDETSVPVANVDRALRETKGELLEDTKHGVFAAYFHADCGGHTEEASEVWGSGEKLGTAVDGGCPMNPRATWTLKMSNDQLSARLAKATKRSMGSVELLTADARTSSGRIASLRVAWSDRSTSALSGNEFRAAVGFDRMRSTQFKITREGSDYVFKGQGYGHGVGLCQWGARQMAKAGHSYKDILKHYYPKALLANAHKIQRELVASRSNRQENFNDEKSDRAKNQQVAQLHK